MFALLGPNGAGKTTTIEILEGGQTRDGGEVRVLGEDPARAGRPWRARVGVVSQGGDGSGPHGGRSDHFAAYHATPRTTAELLAAVGWRQGRHAGRPAAPVAGSPTGSDVKAPA